MIYFLINGQIKNKKYIYGYLENLSRSLNIHRLRSKAIIVRFSKELDDGNQGNCWGDRKEGYITINIAKTCEGEPYSTAEMMQTLAHEMVHAKQYLRGELDGYSGSWKGRKPRNYQYHNQPWEKEAYAREEYLFGTCW
jgi:hypothetical protein